MYNSRRKSGDIAEKLPSRYAPEGSCVSASSHLFGLDALKITKDVYFETNY